VVKRTLSTVALWTVVAAVLGFYRTNGTLLLIGLISVLTLREFYQLLHAMGYRPFDKLGIFFGTLITLSPWF
jgi:phosphatidate cytidylyltransferase